MTVCNFSVQIGLLDTKKVASECYKSNFRWFDIHLCNILFVATIAAFLAFMALNLQNTEFPNSLTPNGPNYMEKLWDLHIFDYMVFKLTFTTFVVLF